MKRILAAIAAVLTMLGPGLAQEGEPMQPPEVMIDRSDPAYVVLLALPGGIPEAQLKKLEPLVREGKAELSTWAAFAREAETRLQSARLRNDYPDVPLTRAVLELLQTYAGTPIGVTWNGGLAFTYADYRHASRMLQKFQQDPAAYEAERPKDRRTDPVHPRNHIDALLGWKD